MSDGNPFFIGMFEGERLRRARARSAALLCAVLALASASAGAVAYRLATDHVAVCRIFITTIDGDEYLAGEGDTVEAAMTGVVVPDNVSGIVWEGCDR